MSTYPFELIAMHPDISYDYRSKLKVLHRNIHCNAIDFYYVLWPTDATGACRCAVPK